MKITCKVPPSSTRSRALAVWILAALLVGIALPALRPSEARAEDWRSLPEVVVDRLSFLLVGRPATDAQKAAYVAGTKSLQGLAEELRSDPALERSLALHFLPTFGVRFPVGFYGMADKTAPRLTLADRLTPGDPVMRVRLVSIGGVRTRVLEYAFLCVAPAPATCTTYVDVQPWWMAGFSHKATQHVVDLCGPRLERCYPATRTFDPSVQYPPPGRFSQLVDEGFLMEPGFFAARVVLDGLPWTEVATSTRSVVNGGMETFLSAGPAAGKRWGDVFLANLPPGSYRNPSGALTFTPRLPEATTYRWVERGPGHSGILTTPAFLMAHNGKRAKANGVYTGLLCNEFTVPSNVKPVESTEPDLAKRPYCKNCHVTIEPLANFFNRWSPPSGAFLYDPALPAAGAFLGMAGVDVPALGSIVVASEDFNVCAVKKAFQFVFGRKPTLAEETGVLGPWVQAFKAHGKKLWPVILEMIGSEAFKEGVSG